MFKKGIFGLKPVLYQQLQMAYIQVAKIIWIIRKRYELKIFILFQKLNRKHF